MNKFRFYFSWFILFVILLFAYRDHFDNAFHFDDGHTILNNMYIRSLDNIPNFFVDGAKTFSSLPSNQEYRPLVSTTIAIDYWLSSVFDEHGSGYNTFYYHLSMFLEYLVLLLVLYKLFLALLQTQVKENVLRWFAFGGAAYFGIHVVNGETLNYIISRSDLISTLFVALALLWFIRFPEKRKFGFFLIPFILGMFTKQTSAVLLPLVVVYYFFFEHPQNIDKQDTKAKRKKYHFRLLGQLGILSVVTGLMVVFVLSMQGESHTPGGSSLFLYMITQPFVVLHYFISFFFPYELSADTDWGLLPGIMDIRFFIGALFVLAMFFIAYKTYRNKDLRLVSFGILWFFITLAPTSSIIPLAEVMNDHRMMFPFVGLVISLIGLVQFLFHKYEQLLRSTPMLQNVLVSVATLIVIGHVWGILERVEVWNDEKSLWKDVTLKSPKNGRGLMNYGLQLASEGKYHEALEYYQRALKYAPNYSYLQTNMAISYNALDSVEKAEQHFKRSIQLSPGSHKGYYYYGRFLKDNARYDEAQENFEKSLQISPDYIYSAYGLMEVYLKTDQIQKLQAIVNEWDAKFPGDNSVKYYQDQLQQRQKDLSNLVKAAIEQQNPEKMLKLSLIYYRRDNFDSCAWLSQRLIEQDPNNIAAYNNLIASLNNLGKYSKAIEFGQKALIIAPDNQLLKNNIAVSQKRANLLQQLEVEENPAALINLSLSFYQEEMYKECILACEKSLKIRPKDPKAYNNICSAYMALKMWPEAVEAGKKAVALDPDYQLAKNNLAYAEKQINP